MSKKRKTRDQKILSDYRRQSSPVTYQFTDQSAPAYKQQTLPTSSPSSSLVHASNHTFVIKDLTKTAILTFGMVVFQVILFFLLHNHKLTIPFIRY